MHALAASLENELITDSRSGVALALLWLVAARQRGKKEKREKEGREKRIKTKEKEGEKKGGGGKKAEREKKRTVCVSPFSEIDTVGGGISDPELVDNATEGDTPGRSRESVIY